MAEASVDFLKQEYSEISKYIVEIVRTRFVVFGAFLAGAIALISLPRPPAAYLFGIAAVFCVVVIDLRNRVLLSQLALRAIAIEAAHLIGPPDMPLPFWMLQHAGDTSFLALAGLEREQMVKQNNITTAAHHRSVRFLKIKLHPGMHKFVTHSFAMDAAYTVFVIVMIWELAKNIIYK